MKHFFLSIVGVGSLVTGFSLKAMEKKAEIASQVELSEKSMKDAFGAAGYGHMPAPLLRLIGDYAKDWSSFFPAVMSRQLVQIPSPSHARIAQVIGLPDNKIAVSYTQTHLVKIIDLSTGKVVNERPDPYNAPTQPPTSGSLLTATPDGRFIVIAHKQGIGMSFVVWDTHEKSSKYLALNNKEYVAASLPTGQLIVGNVSAVEQIELWDPATESRTKITLPSQTKAVGAGAGRAVTVGGELFGVTAALFLPDGSLILGCNNGMLYRCRHIFKKDTQPIIEGFKAHQGKITALALADDFQVITGTEQSAISLVTFYSSGDAPSKPHQTVHRVQEPVASLALCKNQLMTEVITGTKLDGRNSAETVRMWDFATNLPVLSLPGSKQAVTLDGGRFAVPAHKEVHKFASEKAVHILTFSADAARELQQLSSDSLQKLQSLIERLNKLSFAHHKNREDVDIIIEEPLFHELKEVPQAIRACLYSYYRLCYGDPTDMGGAGCILS